MRRQMLAAVAAMTILFAGADEVVVNDGETFVLNGASVANTYDTLVRAKGGATLTFEQTTSAPVGARGFAAYHGVVLPNDSNWPTVGMSEADALAGFKYNRIMDVSQTLTRVMQYEADVESRQFDLYSATWNVAADTTISLFEHMASKVCVILDGTVVFSNNRWNEETAVRGVPLSAGSHTLVVVVATEGRNNCNPKAGNGNYNSEGRYGHANAQKIPGLVYNVNNAELNLSNMTPGVSGVAGTRFFRNESGDDETFSARIPAALPADYGNMAPNPILNAMVRIIADGGPVRLDLSQCHVPAEGIAMVGGLMATNGGSVVVVGSDALRVGGYDNGDKHWTFYKTPLTFENSDGTPNSKGTVAFERCVTVCATPPKWTFADDTRVTLMGGLELLGAGDVTVDSYSLQLATAGAVTEGAKITVNDGRTLRLKPMKFSPDNAWQWWGISSSITNDIALGGSGAKIDLPNVEAIEVVGEVSGAGDVVANYEANTVRANAVTTLNNATFEGTVTAIKGVIAFNQATPGAEGNTVVITDDPMVAFGYNERHYGAVQLQPAGAGSIETVARIRRVEGIAKTFENADGIMETPMNGRVIVKRRQTLEIGTFAGQGGVRGDDASAAVGDCSVTVGVVETNALMRVVLGGTCTVNEIQSDATVVAERAMRLAIGDSPCGVLRVLKENGAYDLTLNGGLRRLEFGSPATVTVGGGAIQNVCGKGTLIVTGAVRIGAIASETVVRVAEGGSVTYAANAVDGAYDLGADINPALWLDADAGASTYRQLSFANHPNVVYTNNSPVIDQIYDVRAWQREYYGWNRRCEGTGETHQQVYPYLLANACNGRTTLQFDVFCNRMNNIWGAPFADDGGTSRAGRRMAFNKPINARFAVMVFGSENGGGTSVLGGFNFKDGNVQYSTPGALQRFPNADYEYNALNGGGSMEAKATNWALPIFNERRPTWIDGVAVDPTVTGFNGKYQILAFEISNADGTDGVPVQSLGACGKLVNDAGGQIYGEVLVFTNVLTAVQRCRVERYLSNKWGIPLKDCDGAKDAQVEVCAGGEFVIEDYYVASGGQIGAVTLAGGKLEIPELALPPGEEAVPRENLRAWYDPDDETRYVKREIANDTRPLAIDALFSKFSGTTAATYDGVAYLSGFLGTTDYAAADALGNADRRPWKAIGARAAGPVRTWIDYTVFSADDRSGNCLRPKTKFSQVTALANAERVPQTFKTAFIVTDTSKGGGNPICDLQAMTPTKARTGYDVSAPIWPSGSLAAAANGNTYLDGRQVDGSAQGYNGRPELLTVETDGNDMEFRAIGFYNDKGANGETNERSHEILGEMIFFTTILDEATRSGIEAYLMKKWLGKVPEGYVDWRDATIGGSGEVAVPSPAYLPKFANDFAGEVEIGNAVLDFALDATGVVTNGIVLPAGVTVKLPASGVVNVTGTGRLRDGVLIDACAIVFGDQTSGIPDGWQLNLIPARAGTRLKIEGGKLLLCGKSGTAILFR